MKIYGRRSLFRADEFSSMSVLMCGLGVLIFLVICVTAGSLSKALGSLRINIEGFNERDRAPVLLECLKDQARSLDGRYSFAIASEESILKERKWNGTRFTDFLTSISKEGQSEYVLFLVRPQGINTFHILRDILVLRNDSLCTTSVPFSHSTLPRENLPKDMRDKLQLGGGKLSFAGKMTPNERELLLRVTGEGSRSQIGALFERSRSVGTCIDHGSELLPAEWKFEKDEQGQVLLLPVQR